MKLSVGKTDLLGPLSKALRAVGRSGYGPVVSCLLLEAYADGVRVTGTDGDLRITAVIEGATVDEPGSVAVSGKLLTDLVKAAPADVVKLEVVEESLTVTSGRMRSSLRLTDAEDFPMGRTLKGDTAEIGTAALFGAIGQVTPSAAEKNDTRPILTGVLCESSSDGMRLVATDSYRLSVKELPKVAFAEADSVIIPARALEEAAKLFEGDEALSVTLDREAVEFANDAASLRTNLIQGAYPNYQTLVDGVVSEKTVSFDVEAMVAAVKRVALLCDTTTPIRLALSSSGVAVSASRSEVGQADDVVDNSNYEGPDTTIGFTPRYLLDALDAIGSGTVTMALSESLKPVLLQSAGDDTYSCLLMPVKL